LKQESSRHIISVKPSHNGNLNLNISHKAIPEQTTPKSGNKKEKDSHSQNRKVSFAPLVD
jgi:hypothetical protein